MGKKVFEVAQELGVDHRKVIRKCDELRINGVRNYMSVLSDGDEARLREAFGQSSSGKVEEVQASGMIRRRRKSPGRGASSGPATRSARPERKAVDAGPARRAATPARRQPGKPEQPAKSAPAAAKPTRAKVLSRPSEPKVEPAKVVERPKAAAQAPAVRRPEARKPEARRQGGARILSKPLPQAAAPQGRRGPKPAPKAPALKARPKPPAAAPAPADPKVDQAVEPAKVESAKVIATPATPAADAPAANEVKSTATKAQPAGGPTRRSGDGPTRRAPAPAEGATQVRKPAPRAGGARVLGRIPLEQLRSRTNQPRRRPGGGGRPGGRPGGPGARPAGRGPGGPPRGPRPSGPGARPGFAPPPPPSGGDQNRRRKGAPNRGNDRNRSGNNRRRGPRVVERDQLYRNQSRRRGGKRTINKRRGSKTQLTTPAAHKRIVRVDGTISVAELGKAMGVKGTVLIGQLMKMGMMVTLNQQLDMETAELLATEHDHTVKNVAFQEEAVLSGPATEEALEADPDAVPRAPVVTIMGHVDHGKTTLLDYIRSANVAEGEAGGITQHIAAYRVKVGDGAVVFLDTPGHAAFTAMRARGASVTDVVVLVVAADDGVMPQTEESINHAKAAGVPIVVAVNKMDKPGADADRIKNEMTRFELVPEEWGGDTMYVPISALKGEGIDALLEGLALQAEVLELKANPTKPAYGRVVESRMQKGRGTVCTVLVQEGTLKKGDYIVSGQQYGRARALFDHHGKKIKSAGPSTPVDVLGMGGVPSAGDAFYVVASERDAKKVISDRSDKARAEREANLNKPQDANALFAAMGQKAKETQNIILKTDVSGSLEAIKASMEQLATDEVQVRIIHSGVGPITESDATLAQASNAVLIGFNVGPDGKAKRVADQGGVKVLQYSIIYDMLDAVKELMSGLLAPEMVEEKLGKAEVRAVFHIQKVGTVAGCIVQDGKVLRNAQGRIFRDGRLVHEGKITTLKRFKDDVREVSHGFECGLSIDGLKDVAVGDTVEIFNLKEIKRQIT